MLVPNCVVLNLRRGLINHVHYRPKIFRKKISKNSIVLNASWGDLPVCLMTLRNPPTCPAILLRPRSRYSKSQLKNSFFLVEVEEKTLSNGFVGRELCAIVNGCRARYQRKFFFKKIRRYRSGQEVYRDMQEFHRKVTHVHMRIMVWIYRPSETLESNLLAAG
jgi:hypothetical protein